MSTATIHTPAPTPSETRNYSGINNAHITTDIVIAIIRINNYNTNAIIKYTDSCNNDAVIIMTSHVPLSTTTTTIPHRHLQLQHEHPDNHTTNTNAIITTHITI